MTKWELARYLMDAKKSVDSIMYIADVLPELEHIPVRAYVNSNRQTFYICCCVLLDNVYLSKKEKQAIRSKDSIVTEVYYQRDKNYAHKDKDYEAVAYDSLNTMAVEMREQLLHIATVCKNHLPPEVTLDFIPYDRILFRMVSGITKAVEDEIYKGRYASLNTPSDGFKKSVSMGGGFCGILNTITTLAMSSYLIEHDRTAPGFYAVDSSLTQLSEAEHKMQSETIKHNFVEYLIAHAHERQVIIVEQLKRMPFVPTESEKDGVHVIRFSRNRQEGRYGFLNEVYNSEDQ